MNDLDFKNLLAFTASVCTIMQFFSGIVICQRFIKNKSTGDHSSIPFISGWLSTSLWLRYGIMIEDQSLVLVNIVGAILFFAYVVTFYLYTLKKPPVIRQFVGYLIFLILVLSYVQSIPSIDQAKTCLGLVCCLVTILFFAAPFVSLAHVIRIKSAESLPYPLIVSTFIVSLQWFIYGIILRNPFIQIPNALGCILSALQLSLFLIFPSKDTTKAFSTI